ncbi:MAG: RAMP superfamily CRISPR-associated protein [Alicyclobacillaceae bacterium]|nr:RAMP superfamily CRISPR-associated protein [Alicyclobacillaceae bacterium]
MNSRGPKSLVEWRWILRPETAWSVRGPGQGRESGGRPLVDWRGRPYVPGSTMKGKIRDSFRRLFSAPEWGEEEEKAAGSTSFSLQKWRAMELYCFGVPGTRPGRLYVDDSYLSEENAGAGQWYGQRHRVAVNRRLGVVKDAFLASETVVEAGWSFEGGMSLYTGNEELVAALTLAVLDVDQIGGGRTVGRGRVSWGLAEGEGTSRLTVTVDGIPWGPAASIPTLREWALNAFFRD